MLRSLSYRPVFLLFLASSLSLLSDGQTSPPKAPLLRLSESIPTRIPADYRSEAQAKITQSEEIQQQAEKMPERLR